jgi:hypothetical protein
MYYSITNDLKNNETLRPWDCESNPVKRTKEEYPYSYSNHLQWVKDADICYITEMPKDVLTVYSDRLWSWDHKKYDECCEMVWGNIGQYFHAREPERIEKFLSLYFNCAIELLKIGEECNQSSGYPLWVFWYRQIKQ